SGGSSRGITTVRSMRTTARSSCWSPRRPGCMGNTRASRSRPRPSSKRCTILIQSAAGFGVSSSTRMARWSRTSSGAAVRRMMAEAMRNGAAPGQTWREGVFVRANACSLFHGSDENMGFRIDPLPSLSVPLLLNETEAICEFRIAEQLITGAFSLAQLLSDSVQVYSGVPTHRARVQLAKPRLPAQGEDDVNGRQTRRFNVGDLGKKAEGDPGL